jgi:hypothetical protein
MEKTPRLKAGQVECQYDVWRGSPPNFEVSLSAEIAGPAGIARINQRFTSIRIDSVVR